MVQMSEVARIYAAWIERGMPPCDHPRVDREYHLGSRTGDLVCLLCGREVFDR